MNNQTGEKFPEKNKILVVADNLSFGLKLKKRLEKKETDVFLVQKFRLVEWLNLKKRVLPRVFDKVIVALFEDVFISSDKEGEILFSFLKKRSEQIFIFLNYLTPIKNEQKIFEKWKKQQREFKKHIIEANLLLPEANIILGENLIFLNNPKRLPISFFYDFYKDGIINDLNEPLSLISDDDYLETVEEFIFTPFRKKRILIKNREIKSNKITRYILLKNNFKNASYQIFQAGLKKEKEKNLDFEIRKVDFPVDEILRKSLIILPPAKNIIGYQNNNFIKKRKQSFKDKDDLTREITFLKEELFNKEKQTESKKEKVVIQKKDGGEKKSEEKQTRKTQQKESVAFTKNEKKKLKIKQKTIKRVVFFAIAIFLLFNFFYFKIIEREVFRKIEEKGWQNLGKTNIFLAKTWKSRPKINFLYKKQNYIYDLALSYDKFTIFLDKVKERQIGLFNYVFKNEGENNFSFNELDGNEFDFIKNLENESFFKREDFKKIAKEEKKKINKLNNLSSLWEEFSKKEQQNILLLFLNEQQIRSQGGSIEATCLLSFRKGKLFDIQVLQTDQINYLLNKEFSISKEWEDLNKEKPTFKDLTFYDDFDFVASNSSVLAEEVYKKKIDGVFSFNVNTLGKLLEIAGGEIEIEQIHEKVNVKNIYDRILFYSNQELKNNNSNFSKLLIEAIFKKISNLDDEKIGKFWEALNFSLENKNSALFFQDEGENSVVKNLGWGGEEILSECQKISGESKCFLDSVLSYDNSLGNNKVGAYIKKQEDLKINISNEKISYLINNLYKNEANSYTWPLGNYNLYKKYLLPKNAQNIKVLIDNENKENFSIKKNDEFQVITFPVEISLKSQKNISISYDVLFQVETGMQWQYSFFKNKQTMLGDDYEQIVITYPNNFELLVLSPQAEFNTNNQLINFKWDKDEKDKFINVLFFVH